MPSNFKLLLLGCIASVTTHAQNDKLPTLNIGDPPPPLKVHEWLKGTPVRRFEKGKLYVVEFWATWCAPCRAAMPHLSALAREYKDRVTFLGIDVMEGKTTSLLKVKAFVDSMGEQMAYHVAAADGNVMKDKWIEASGEQFIPSSFVVNAGGRLAWFGHPKDLPDVLSKIVENTWDINKELKKRKSNKDLEKFERYSFKKIVPYLGDVHKPGDFGKPDSVLLVIDELVRKEPKLKYAPLIAYQTFLALLKTDMHKAYDYGKAVLVTSTYDEPACYAIIDPIRLYSENFILPGEIYQLGTEAYQVRIHQIPYPEIVHFPRLYSRMAEWYWCANEKTKAIDAQKKAIEVLNAKIGFSYPADTAAYESVLKYYEKK